MATFIETVIDLFRFKKKKKYQKSKSDQNKNSMSYERMMGPIDPRIEVAPKSKFFDLFRRYEKSRYAKSPKKIEKIYEERKNLSKQESPKAETFPNEVNIMFKRFVAAQAFIEDYAQNTKILYFYDADLASQYRKDLWDLYHHLQFAKKKFKLESEYGIEIVGLYNRILGGIEILLRCSLWTGGYDVFDKQYPFSNFPEKVNRRILEVVCKSFIVMLKKPDLEFVEKQKRHRDLHPIYRSYLLNHQIFRAFEELRKKMPININKYKTKTSPRNKILDFVFRKKNTA